MSVWVAGATVVAGVAGAAISSSAAKSAANKQSDAAAAATALQQQQYQEAVQRNAPWVAGGTQGFNSLLDGFGLSGNTGAANYGAFNHMPTADEVMAQPGYQFGLEQGQRGVNNALNARGMSYSGAAIKAASRFNTDYATGQYNNAFNRLMDSNRFQQAGLNNLATMGQAAANNQTSAGTQYANAAGNNLFSSANAQGAAGIGSANVWGNALNQGVSAYKQYAGGSSDSSPYTTPNMFGNYSNPSGSTYDYRGGYLDNSLRGGG